MFLFFKAMIPGGAAADLFTMPVQVAGHVRDGKFITPYASTRKKAPERPGQADLFAPPPPLTEDQKKLLALVRSAREAYAKEGDKEATNALDAMLANPRTIDPAKAKEVIHAAGDRWRERIGEQGRKDEETRRLEAKAKQAVEAAKPEALGELGQAAAEKPAPPKVPDAIKARVQRGLAILADVEAALEGARKTDAKFQGDGRYESEVWVKQTEEREKGKRILALFRKKATELGIDPEETIRELGGEPDTSMSPAGQAYTDGAKKPEPLGTPAEPPKERAHEGPLLAGLPDDAELIERGGKWMVRVGDVETGLHTSAADAAADARAKLATAADTAPLVWGVPPGTKPAERRRLNAAAVDLLNRKADAEMTAADKQVLARYTGNGGCGASLNEYYTDPDVCRAMWTMLANAGFEGGEVLEPSCGTGAFMFTAPPGAYVAGVELEGISSRIARILFPQHQTETSACEGFATTDGRRFHAVIGNPPFGVRGGRIKDDKPWISNAEQYFLDTAIDKTRDGGLVCMVVPTGIMDNKSARTFRENLLRKSEFLGAFRMPNTAFEASHTSVTTDVVMFRRRPDAIAGALGAVSQDQLQAVGAWDDEFLAGTYFTGRGAPHVLGKATTRIGAWGEESTVEGSMSGVPASLAQWHPDSATREPLDLQAIVDAVPDEDGKRRVMSAAQKTAYQTAKLGDVRVINGVRYVLRGEPPRWHLLDEDLPASVSDARGIAESLEDLAEGRAKDPAFVRANLTEALDQFVRDHGLPTKNKDLKAWLAAPFLPNRGEADAADHTSNVRETQRRIARILGAVREDGSYSDLVTGREAEQNATLDTVATKLALETGGFTPDQLTAAWAHGDSESVLDHLYASNDYALDPDGQTWTTMDAYLSGNLWDKYDAAKAMAAHEGLTPAALGKYRRQAELLDEAIGPQSLDSVEVMVNSGFIDPHILTAWSEARYQERTDSRGHGNQWDSPVIYIFENSVWKVGRKDGSSVYGDDDLLEKYLNRRGVKKDDKPRLDRLNREFKAWLLGSEYRDEVENLYNRTYRGFRQKAYSDTAIEVPGLNPAISVNAYQWPGIRWALEGGKGIVAADVGLGKTPRALILTKLAKATGQCKRPAIVVPKSVLANWVAEAEMWFPGSKVLTIGESYSKAKDGSSRSTSDNEEVRRRKWQDFAQNDYDFVFVSMPAWNEIDLDPLTKGEYLESDFWVQRGDHYGNAGDKRQKKIREAYAQAKAKREFTKRENTIYFGDTGCDMLIMDEGHAYKNLYSIDNRFGESPKFLGGGGESNRAQDTYFKTKWVRDNNGGKGVFMLTATPTKNSPLEIYSMLAHIAPEAFERMGIKNSEEFIDRFCDFSHDMILGINGEREDALVAAGFKNLDELREVMRQYIDRKTAEDVGLKIPAADVRDHLVDMTKEQEAEYVTLRKLASQSGGKDSTGDAHIFSIIDKMNKVATDPELFKAKYKGVSPKIAEMVKHAVAGSADGGQVIFCDFVATHDKIAAALVAAGVPREKIGICNAQVASTSAQRQALSDAFNAGKLDYIIGNTPTMGEGVNLQKRTADIHHLDLPWEPASVQQRNGRGRRQGNKKESIRIHTYLSKGSFDGYRWQTVAAKRDWQDLLWNGGNEVENLQRQNLPGRQSMLIMLSADPDGEARKYEASLSEAKREKAISGRVKVSGQFDTVKSMRASLAALDKKGVKGSARDRLERKLETMTQALKDNPSFPAKLLESDEPAIFEPVGNNVWTKGKAFEVQPGPDSPLQDTAPSKWVVDIIEPDTKKVWARRYGSGSAGSVHFKVDSLQGVTPVAYSADDEAAVIKADAEQVAKMGGSTRSGPADAMTFERLRGMNPDVVKASEPELQALLKKGVRDYTAGSVQYVPMVDKEGTPVLRQSYHARELMDTHDIMLPTEENRKKMVEAMVNADMTRELRTHFPPQTRRNSRYSNGPNSSDGIKAKWKFGPDITHETDSENPWATAAHNIFSGGIGKEAQEELARRVTANIEAAPDMQRAMQAAMPGLHFQPYSHRPVWPKWLADALRARAGSLDNLNARLMEVARPRGYNEKDNPIHPDLYKQAVPYGLNDVTVDKFLEMAGQRQ